MIKINQIRWWIVRNNVMMKIEQILRWTERKNVMMKIEQILRGTKRKNVMVKIEQILVMNSKEKWLSKNWWHLVIWHGENWWIFVIYSKGKCDDKIWSNFGDESKAKMLWCKSIKFWGWIVRLAWWKLIKIGDEQKEKMLWWKLIKFDDE